MNRNASQINDNVINAADEFTAAYDNHQSQELDLINSTEESRSVAAAILLEAQSRLMTEVALDAAAMPYFQRGIYEAIRSIKADRIG